MKRIVLAGLLVLGLGSAACRDEPESVAAGVEPLGPGARGALEPEPGADMGELQRLESLPEPSTVVTGTVHHVSKDLLTLEDRTGQRMDLHADPETCLLWNGEPIQPTQLGEGTAVRVSFEVDPEDGVTARVVRVIEQQRPAP